MSNDMDLQELEALIDELKTVEVEEPIDFQQEIKKVITWQDGVILFSKALTCTDDVIEKLM